MSYALTLPDSRINGGASYPQKAVDCPTYPRINGGAEMAYPRINGGGFTHKWWRTYIEPVFPVSKCTCSRSCAYWGQVCDLPPKRLALATNSRLKRLQ